MSKREGSQIIYEYGQKVWLFLVYVEVFINKVHLNFCNHDRTLTGRMVKSIIVMNS
jgi:hypothetical protein